MKRSLLLLLLVLSWACGANASSVTYRAAIDTSTLAGTTGSLDFNFQAGPFGSLPATVQITRFSGNGLPSGSPFLSGNASGSLPGDLLLGNDGAYNDYFQAFTFGSILSFDLTLSGPAVGSAGAGTSGSTFAFSIFSDTDGTRPALTSNPDGYALTADINLDGSTTFRSFTTPVTPVSVTPEPASALLGITGMVFTLMLCWRRCS